MSLIYGLTRELISDTATTPQPRYAPFFDGVTQYAELAQRAIDVDGDIDIEFRSPDSINLSCTVLSQCISDQTAEMEFRIASYSNQCQLTVGGVASVVMSSANIYKPSTFYRFRLVGETLTIFENETPTREIPFNRGVAREPAARTIIGARSDGVGVSGLYRGLQYDVKINGTTWPMNERNQAIQLPSPLNLPQSINPSRGEQLPASIEDAGSFSIVYASGAQFPQLQAGTYMFEIDIDVKAGSFRARFNNLLNSALFTETGRELRRGVITIDDTANRFDLQSTSEGSACVLHQFRLFKIEGNDFNPLTIINHTDAMWRQV